MYKNNTTKAFTLVELIVWISIIWVLALWLSNLNLNRLSINQKSEIELTKIISIIEETRNNALIGRWVWVNLDTPDSWSVVIDASSWNIESQWELESGATWALSSWVSPDQSEITNMRCQTIDGLNNDTVVTRASIHYDWLDGSITWCSDSTFKKIVFDFDLAWIVREISINTVTWVIEQRK